MADQQSGDKKRSVDFRVDPAKTPILYSESYLISSSENSVVFNFAQPIIGAEHQNIVSRIAMNREQAKQFLKNLNDHIEKYEL